MKLTAKVKLLPDDEQRAYLLETLERANAACDFISDVAWESKVFGAFKLQKLVYTDVREHFDLSAQIVIRIISKVSDAYRLDKKAKRAFRPHGAIAYDDRILKWYTDLQRVSIWSVGGRLNIPYQCGERQRELLIAQKGESDLVYSKGAFYLLATCEIPDPTEQETETALGVDLGVINIATDSDGQSYSGMNVERTRQRMHKTRRRLQKDGSHGAKRKLKQLSGKQARFQRDTNHVIAKRLVETAQHTQRSLRLEDLTGIGSRTRVMRREQRDKHSNWSFFDLRQKILYKAKLAGVRVELVAPEYTSQRCSVCGHIEKANRRTQSEFLCCACGHSMNADVNAAINISVWATVISPHVAPSGSDKPRGFSRCGL